MLLTCCSHSTAQLGLVSWQCFTTVWTVLLTTHSCISHEHMVMCGGVVLSALWLLSAMPNAEDMLE